jgi:hypothetical protein
MVRLRHSSSPLLLGNYGIEYIPENTTQNNAGGFTMSKQFFTEGMAISGVMEGITKNLEEHELYIYLLYEMILELKKENEELRRLIEQSNY